MSKILQTTQPILSKNILNFPTPHYKTNNVILIHGYKCFNFFLFLVNNVAVLVINVEETVWKTSLAYFVAPWFNFLIFIALQIGCNPPLSELLFDWLFTRHCVRGPSFTVSPSTGDILEDFACKFCCLPLLQRKRVRDAM